MSNYIRPQFRVELLSEAALVKMKVTLTQLAGEAGCTEGSLRKYQAGGIPGGEILGNLVQALRARGVHTSAGHALGIEAAPGVLVYSPAK